MYGQCTISGAGSCIGGEITEMPVKLSGALMYSQCMASEAGSCIDVEITRMPVKHTGA